MKTYGCYEVVYFENLQEFCENVKSNRWVNDEGRTCFSFEFLDRPIFGLGRWPTNFPLILSYVNMGRYANYFITGYYACDIKKYGKYLESEIKWEKKRLENETDYAQKNLTELTEKKKWLEIVANK